MSIATCEALYPRPQTKVTATIYEEVTMERHCTFTDGRKTGGRSLPSDRPRILRHYCDLPKWRILMRESSFSHFTIAGKTGFTSTMVIFSGFPSLAPLE